MKGYLNLVRKRCTISKLLIIILMLAMSGCATNIAQAETADRPDNNKELQAFCKAKASSLQKLFHSVAVTNSYLLSMIHEDTRDLVPILFAQCKTENLGIMLFAVSAEVVRTEEAGEVSNTTLMMLDQYIDFLKYDLIKAKLFEGMISDSNKRLIKTEEQLVLKKTVVNLEVGYNLLVHMRGRLEELR